MLNLVGYQIQAQIYESRNSLVYRGRRLPDQFPVVLKQLKPEKCTPAHLACYRKEYAILRHLRLPGVIQAYGLETSEASPVLILEDCGGQSLEHWILKWQATSTGLTLPLIDFLQLAIAITKSLGQLHSAQIIHKDIKPSNIIWNPVTAALRLIDFGIAKQILGKSADKVYANRLEGTLAYLAPEQTGRINQAVDHRSDLYALGVTFYELLTGQIPFVGNDAQTIIQGHLTQPPIPPHVIQSQIPPALSRIVLKLMAKDPSDRYASAGDLQLDLIDFRQKLQHQGSILTRPSLVSTSNVILMPEKHKGIGIKGAAVPDWMLQSLTVTQPCELEALS